MTMRTTPDQFVETFRKRGFVVLPGLLDAGEVERCLRVLERLSGRRREEFRTGGGGLLARGFQGAWTQPDGVTQTPELWHLINRPGLLARVRLLLGDELRYLPHSDLHVGFSAVGWHRDSVDRRYPDGPDWDERLQPYRLARVGLYLQPRAEVRFALGLVPGSHRHGVLPEEQIASFERHTRGIGQLIALVRGRSPLDARAEWVEADAGDAIVFDPRILHAGRPAPGPKYSLFFAYGVPNMHYQRHHAYYRRVRADLGYLDVPPALSKILAASGIDPLAAPAAASVGRSARPSWLQTWLASGLRPGAGSPSRTV
jgi:hypothetical protein